MSKESIEEIAKSRGFFWLSSEIYGGLGGFYDYGHIGSLLKKKWENLWRKYFLSLDENFYEIEPCNIMHENVFKASGHIDSFVDPIVKCKKCKKSERADHIIEEQLKESFEGLSAEELTKIIKKHNVKCPACGGELEEVGILNMMFPVKAGDATAYLRPETAQGAYVNFLRCYEHLRRKIPFGLAIVGKAYRNEINPRNSLIRMREFTQAELQIFFDPSKMEKHEKFSEIEEKKLRIKFSGKNEEWILCGDLNLPKMYVYYLQKIQHFYLDILKIPEEKFRFRELSEEERAFYNRIHFDIELKISGIWREVGGLHYRTDHDLKGHEKISKQKMQISENGNKFMPHVLELSFGVDRNIYALLDVGYHEEKVKEEERIIFRLPKCVSPYDCAVFPLVSKDSLPERAKEVRKTLSSMFSVFYDESGSIGRRYRRMDEIGVSACITIDHQTLEDGTVTLRDRDSMKQDRVKIDELCSEIYKFLEGKEPGKL